ncbi:MAG: hypothetical protein C0506_15900 [Anaerolinea sp.]|nr:hypothetical protein [Anaerolinea sp.]
MLVAPCSLLVARCSRALGSLLSALCSLLSALCSLLSALCSLLSALCSLLFALCSSLRGRYCSAVTMRWLAGAVVVVLFPLGMVIQAGGAGASRFKVFTVEVSEAGFNPGTCQISRDNYVQFKNVGRGPIRVIRDGSGGTLTFDSGELKPGQVSNQDFFPHGGTAKFYDYARPNNSLTVVLPVWSPEWDESCEPVPGLNPIPGFDCIQKANCAVLPSVASDR